MENKKSLYIEKKQIAKGDWLDKKCYWCGEYLQQDEKIVLLVISCDYKNKYKKLSRNVVMHEDEFTQLVSIMYDDHEKILEALGTRKTKRVSSELTEKQKTEVEAFKSACRAYGFYIETGDKSEVKMRKSGTSYTFVYNARTGRLRIRSKVRNRGMFDGIYERELEAKIYNKMKEILGSNDRDNFTAQGLIDKAMSDVDKMFK